MRRPRRGGLREMKELMMRKTGWRSEEDTRWRRERWRVLKKEASEVNRERAKKKKDEGNNDSDENEGASLNETCQ